MKKLAIASVLVLPAMALIAVIAATTSAEQVESAQRRDDADSRPAVVEREPPKEQDRGNSAANDDTEPAVAPQSWTREANLRYPARRIVCRKVDGKLHGELKAYAEDGRLLYVDHYDHDVLEGLHTDYYPSGRKFSEVRFRNGQPTGRHDYWFEDGTLAFTMAYVDGVVHGRVTTYFPNGVPCVDAKVVRGLREGEASHYLPDGRKFGITFWEDGQQIGQRGLIEPRQLDLEAIQQRNQFSVNLKDHWE